MHPLDPSPIMARPSPRPKAHRALAEALAFTTTPVSYTVSVAGARYVTFRILTATQGGTLSFAFLRPNGTTEYTTDNPSSVAVVAGTEIDSSEITCGGQSYLKVTFTGSGSGTITYLDVMQI